MIELQNIAKTYKMGETTVNALRGVNLKIDDGDFVAIMGPSGSGKSTMANILGLLDVPSSGSYKFNNREVLKLSEDDLAVLRREEIGFIFQQFNLLPRMTAAENVALPLLYSQHNIDLEFAKELLNKVNLGSRFDHKPSELSGGQQQRVAIARSLINKPKMILADEPTGNLDSQSEKEIMAILKDLNSQGITIVIITHEEEIGLQAKRLIKMRDGQIQSDERNNALIPSSLEVPKENIKKEDLSIKEIFEYFRQGFRTLIANKVRTCLSMLGILIGVAAVVATLAIGNGAQKAIEKQLASLGSNLVTLRPGSVRVGGVAQESGLTTRLTFEDAAAIKEKINSAKEVSPSVNGQAQITYLNQNWSTQIIGATPIYAKVKAAEPIAGRFFSDEENSKRLRVALIGTTVMQELFADQNPIGEMIKINKVSFQIIGILPQKGANGFRDQDDVIIIPITTAMHRLLGKNYVDSIDIEARDANLIDEMQSEILNLMYSRKRVSQSQRRDAFQIRNMADVKATLSESSRTMSILLSSIAAISLLVGGIGIMNIMLVSVTERTKEIGLRKAIGGRKRDILMQFLSESVVVSVIGGLIGIVLGIFGAKTLSLLAGWDTIVSIQSIILAFSFSVLIGLIFGIYPAKKAATLAPIDALRYE
ncbi:MAG: ATP-binding cassette domain-containing protein [Proteobacteria bacterium]|nr:ATP-binding cassette domain-containing protein [Pseudomonadota bacterium]